MTTVHHRMNENRDGADAAADAAAAADDDAAGADNDDGAPLNE